MNLAISTWEKWYRKHRRGILEDYFRFLQFKSISADPSFAKECNKCAKWLKSYLTKMGLKTEIWETTGKPVVFATYGKEEPNRPTLLLYHHYDVQPVDPLELWKSDPFTPTVRKGSVYARGAQDNKGQCFYSLSAVRALLELCDPLRFNLKIFIEGEEESGSSGTEEILLSQKKALKSDYLLVVDSGLTASDIPSISLGIRGILTMEITCRGADIDLHSGSLGGIAYNPNRALATALSKLWDVDGKVAIPHFYEDVKGISESELSRLDLDVSEEEMRKNFGLRALCPEPGFSIGESVTIRPTVEINGMSGGYAGEGFKTVIPAVAKAKVSCRLVPDQDPQKIFKHLKNFLERQMPKGMEIEIQCDHGAPAFRSSKDSLIAKLTAKAYEDVLKKPCQHRLSGGSVPIVAQLAKVSQAATVMMGYGLDTDQIHAPNEHFGLDRFEKGFLTMGRIFSRLNESGL